MHRNTWIALNTLRKWLTADWLTAYGLLWGAVGVVGQFALLLLERRGVEAVPIPSLRGLYLACCVGAAVWTIWHFVGEWRRIGRLNGEE